MPRIALKMKLFVGQAAEYKRRHDVLWPELYQLLKTTGISNYSIFLDEETHILFGVLDVEDEEKLRLLPQNPIMKRWWAYMKDIMDTNPDNSPIEVKLNEVFYMT